MKSFTYILKKKMLCADKNKLLKNRHYFYTRKNYDKQLGWFGEEPNFIYDGKFEGYSNK